MKFRIQKDAVHRQQWQVLISVVRSDIICCSIRSMQSIRCSCVQCTVYVCCICICNSLLSAERNICMLAFCFGHASNIICIGCACFSANRCYSHIHKFEAHNDFPFMALVFACDFLYRICHCSWMICIARPRCHATRRIANHLYILFILRFAPVHCMLQENSGASIRFIRFSDVQRFTFAIRLWVHSLHDQNVSSQPQNSRQCQSIWRKQNEYSSHRTQKWAFSIRFFFCISSFVLVFTVFHWRDDLNVK